MFVLRSEQVISPGRAEDYDAYQLHSLEAARGQPGFLWEIRLRYLGNYAKRLTYQLWESKEARLTYSRGAAWVRAPHGLLVGPADSGFYAKVAGVQDAPLAVGQYVVDRHFRVSNGVQGEFDALEAGLCDLAKGQPGFVARQGLKFLGNDTSYVRVSIWRSWEDVEQWVSTAEYVAENDAVMGRVVWTTADRYEIIAMASEVPAFLALP